MNAIKVTLLLAGSAALLLLPGCATSPEAETRRQAIEADIDEVLSYELDPAEFGTIKRCLAEHEYRGFRPLGVRHILFEGRGEKLWVNTLRGRCNDLRWGDVLVIRQFGDRRMCDADRFEVADWFDYPWYRRWPWHWGSWGTGATCALGKFQPVTQAQVDEIETLLEPLN